MCGRRHFDTKSYQKRKKGGPWERHPSQYCGPSIVSQNNRGIIDRRELKPYKKKFVLKKLQL